MSSPIAVYKFAPCSNPKIDAMGSKRVKIRNILSRGVSILSRPVITGKKKNIKAMMTASERKASSPAVTPSGFSRLNGSRKKKLRTKYSGFLRVNARIDMLAENAIKTGIIVLPETDITT